MLEAHKKNRSWGLVSQVGVEPTQCCYKSFWFILLWPSATAAQKALQPGSAQNVLFWPAQQEEDDEDSDDDEDGGADSELDGSDSEAEAAIESAKVVQKVERPAMKCVPAPAIAPAIAPAAARVPQKTQARWPAEEVCTVILEA